MYLSVLSAKNATKFVDDIFEKYDTDNNGSIDFKEFLMATHPANVDIIEEKLHWAFRMYDSDSSGTIEAKELVAILCSMYEEHGVSESGR